MVNGQVEQNNLWQLWLISTDVDYNDNIQWVWLSEFR